LSFGPLWRRLRGGIRRLAARAARFPSNEEVAAASRKYAGMTMNERLYCAGLMHRWDAAVARYDRRALLRIAARVGIADGPMGRSWIVDTELGKHGGGRAGIC
jgi:hypothetical protein